MNIADAERLVEVVQALDSAGSSGLKKVAEHVAEQLKTEVLRLGVAAEPGRPTDVVQKAAEGDEICALSWDLVTSAEPAGMDGWVLVLSADQLGSLKERALVEALEDMSEQLLVFVGRMDRVPEDRVEDIRKRTNALFEPLGVAVDRIYYEVEPLVERIQGWTSEREGLRKTAVHAALRPHRTKLGEALEQLKEELENLPQLEPAQDQLQMYQLAATTVIDALSVSGPEINDQIKTDILESWEGWIDTVIDNHGARLSQESFAEEATAWLKARFLPQLERSIRRKVADFADQVPQMEAAMGNIQSQAGELSAPPVNLGPPPKQNRLRFLLPVAGAGIGSLIGGKKYAAVGGAIGGAGFALWPEDRLARGRLLDEQLKSVVVTHFTSFADVALRKIVEELRMDAQLEIVRLKEVVRQAEELVEQRGSMDDRHKRLSAVIDALEALLQD